MSNRKSLFSKDSHSFWYVKNYIRYKKLYQTPLLSFISEEFKTERSIATFIEESKKFILLSENPTSQISQEEFQQELDSKPFLSIKTSLFDWVFYFGLLTQFTEKKNICFQLLLNSISFESLFLEYNETLKDKFSKRICWEIFLQAISKRMISKKMAQKYLSRFINDYIEETNEFPSIRRSSSDQSLSEEQTCFFQEEADYSSDSQKISALASKGDLKGDVFQNLWLFDKKLLEIMLIFYFVSTEIDSNEFISL